MFNLSTQEVVLSIEKSPLRIVHGTIYQEYQDFFGKDNLGRWGATLKHKDDFGDKFILFPNLIYGNWEEGFEE